MLSSKHSPERRLSAENLQDGEDAGLTKRIERLENKIDSLEKELWFRSRRYNAALTGMQRTLNITIASAMLVATIFCIWIFFIQHKQNLSHTITQPLSSTPLPQVAPARLPHPSLPVQMVPMR
ncbi:hypothetical protein [Laribacter hongkongensis]|uniref:hypothetical protein n=1 Tax=Laribacter hongkongensis TaxID=168471 RepID=UPI001EFDEC92|nr:hypothetical protein [Laribacter hongkongensis]MCG9093528.1 hypothetical protein [Laribacter hongkongensis]